jgi:hypothetical protein
MSHNRRIHVKLFAYLIAALLGGGLVGTALADAPTAPKPADKASEDEAKIKANLAKLSDADRKEAEAQRFCAVENEDRLGSMGVPVKILIKDQPVFLCCKGCTKQANADPEKTLAKVKELKAKYGEKK